MIAPNRRALRPPAVSLRPQIRRLTAEPRHHSRAFTLVEMLVVIAIVGVLVGLMLPAIQGLRELGRRSQCSANLTGIGRGLAAYEFRYGHLPVGTVQDGAPVRNLPEGLHHNWLSRLLPDLDLNNVYLNIDFTSSVYADPNRPVRELAVPALQCPSSIQQGTYVSNYAGVCDGQEIPIDSDSDGLFVLNEPIAFEQITDGLAYTLAVGEKTARKRRDLGWISGTRASLRNTGSPVNATRSSQHDDPRDPLVVGGFASEHPGGAQFLDASGGIRLLSKTVDPKVFSQSGTRNDGQLPSDWSAGPPTEPAEPESQKKPQRKDADEAGETPTEERPDPKAAGPKSEEDRS